MTTRPSRGAVIQALLAILEERGWRLLDIAFVLKVSEQTIRSWSNGNPPRTEDTIDRLRALVDDPTLNPALEREENIALFREYMDELMNRGWKLQAIARKMQYNRQRLSQWRRGYRSPPKHVVTKLRGLLGEAPPRSRLEAILDLMGRESEGNVYELGTGHLVRKSGYSRTAVDEYLERLKESGMIRQLNSLPGKPLRWLILVRPDLLKVSRNVNKEVGV